ncbi:hypothetical protein TNCV_4705541 [Trichonephila clavipes]|nr:hypothetical protein TNCV_4705541 [Trichonephila clavipes]
MADMSRVPLEPLKKRPADGADVHKICLRLKHPSVRVEICLKRLFLQNGLEHAEVVVDFSPAHPRGMEIPCVILTA